MSDIQIRTMEEAFYLQTKAFLEKNSEHIAEIARLKAEVERLTKAGDAMADYLFDAPFPCRVFYHKWIAAKEGKQP